MIIVGVRRIAGLQGFNAPNHASQLIMLFASLTVICSACQRSQEPSPKMSESPETASPNEGKSPNNALLDEANAGGRWSHAKKTRPIWARRLEAAQTVKTLEGEEQVAAGHYLCRGEAAANGGDSSQALHSYGRGR